jgi:hypothetical protein
MSMPFHPFIPAKAGTQAELAVTAQQDTPNSAWVPAFAGMNGIKGNRG